MQKIKEKIFFNSVSIFGDSCERKDIIKKDGGGVIILVALFTLFFSSLMISVISSPVASQLRTNKDILQSKKSFFLSESGNEDIVYRLKKGENINNVKDLSIENGLAETSVTDLGDGLKEIITIADFGTKIRKIRSRIQTTSGVSFNYGLFTGQGGIEMENNTRINGSIYSNGSIEGSSNVTIAGDVYVAPRPSTTTDMKWENQTGDFLFGRNYNGERRLDVMQSFIATADDLHIVKISLYLKKIGSPSNIIIKIAEDKNGNPDKNHIKATGTLSSNLVGLDYSFVDVGFDDNPEIDLNKKYWIILETTKDNNNYYSWGIDNAGGYADGSAKYSSDWTKKTLFNISGDLNFQVWAGDENSLGLLDSVFVGDEFSNLFSAYAHTIVDSQISGDVSANLFENGSVGGNINANEIKNCSVIGDADYNVSTNCLVGGTETTPTVPPSDPPYLPMPVSETNITTWKDDASVGGIISTGDFTPSDGSSFGPGVIEGNLIIESGNSVDLEGTVYVKGNIEIYGGASLNLGISYGSSGSGLIISDGWIDLYNNVNINSPRTGSGHLMLLSTARCDKYYGFSVCNSEESSINVENNVNADILVAPYGAIEMSNNVDIVSLSGDQLNLKNNIILNYEQGLTNMNFSSGPSGSWNIESWREME